MLPAFGQRLENRDSCLAAITKSFKDLPQEQINEFLKLQGEITLNRLSWAYLSHRPETKGKLDKLENTILQLLDEKYTNTHPDFIKVRESFEKSPLSRESLAKISPYISEVLKKQNKTEKNTGNDTFVLNTSDLKFLEILAEYEETAAFKKDHASASSILNYTKIINSSYKGLGTPEIPKNIDFIEDHLQDLNIDLIHFLNEIPTPEQCFLVKKKSSEEGEVCADEKVNEIKLGDLFQDNEDFQALILDMVQSEFLSDHKLYYGLKYGEIWQEVKLVGNPEKTKLKNKIPTKKSVIPKNKSQEYDSSLNWIQDPLHLIVNDKKGRKEIDWKNFDKKYLEAFAKSIYNNEAVFLVDDKLYDRQTGKSLNLRSLSTKYFLLAPLLKGKSDKEAALIAEAFMNGKKSVVLGDDLYSTWGKKLDPVSIIVEHRKKELKVNRSPADYKSFARPYILAMAQAVMNKGPSFFVGKKEYDTMTGRDKLSPFLSTKKFVNYDQYEVEKRKTAKLSETDLIRKYHKDHASKIKCDKFAVVDKSSNRLQVFRNSGEKVSDLEVLLGQADSDIRTKFLDYKLKKSNRSTGAGIYTIGELRNQQSYYKKFSGNLFTLNNEAGKEERVLAVHQVPKGFEGRNKLFNDGDSSNNRVTDGCINLQQADFEKLKNLIGPGCKIYVLPEEEGNRIVLKNDELNFTSDKKIPVEKRNDYHFSSKDQDYRPIKIDIDPKIYKDFEKDIREKRVKDPRPYVTGFGRAIEDEKKTLMSLYGIDNDDYNELAKLAFGIMGQESQFGTHIKLWAKEGAPGMVPYIKCLKQGVWEKIKDKSFDIGCKKIMDEAKSRGLTQMKAIPDKIKTKYPEIKSENLVNARYAAIATMGYLAEGLVELKGVLARNRINGKGVQVSRSDIMDYMIYIYNGSRFRITTDDKTKQAIPKDNVYFKNTKKYSNYMTVREYR